MDWKLKFFMKRNFTQVFSNLLQVLSASSNSLSCVIGHVSLQCLYKKKFCNYLTLNSLPEWMFIVVYTPSELIQC